ncbi:MAG: winged helix-turn-helix domain-containing protein [Salinigranum sp.]
MTQPSGRESDVEWDQVSFVISSRYRIEVCRRLMDGPATPSHIAEETDCAISHTSRALQELRERSLVELLVSEQRKKGRMYGITREAERVWQTIEAQNLV